jgi:hypothetical protein
MKCQGAWNVGRNYLCVTSYPDGSDTFHRFTLSTKSHRDVSTQEDIGSTQDTFSERTSWSTDYIPPTVFELDSNPAASEVDRL